LVILKAFERVSWPSSERYNVSKTWSGSYTQLELSRTQSSAKRSQDDRHNIAHVEIENKVEVENIFRKFINLLCTHYQHLLLLVVLIVSTGARGAVVWLNARVCANRDLSIGILLALVSGKAVVCTIELKGADVGVALDTSGLLETAGQVLGNHAEDGNLALDNLLLAAGAHVARDVVDETLLSTVVKDLLPQDTGSVEVLRTDLRQEGDGLA